MRANSRRFQEARKLHRDRRGSTCRKLDFRRTRFVAHAGVVCRHGAFSEALGERFVARLLPDSAAATELPPFFATPHSAAHLTDEAGQPTNAARDEIISFFARRLKS